mmetsp:Transcript_63645/g.207643  ORF Transcript_63645/g.207643 Transcript_63645/m.207643 type:complete len:923 (-) Transcript_63645:22-2790(-)
MMVKPVLEGICSKQWRAQLAAIQLFGTIVSELGESAPKRMAMILPQAVPPLCEAASSPRSELRDAVKSVLEKVGVTIAHRDVAVLAPQLIAALVDPSEKPIVKALDALLSAVYTTAIDAAACALICPVVERALRQGDAEAQQKAASFARGLVLHAGESEELSPFFAVLRPPLEALLSHPNPGVRDAAAQAIGALVGEGAAASSSDLLARLDAQQDGAEIEGTAQGIAAAMASVSEETRAEMLAELLRQDIPKHGRLGRLCVFAHLPKSLAGSAEGAQTVAETLPAMSVALSDSDEAIRDMARRGLGATVDAAKHPELVAAVAANLVDALRADDMRARVAAAELVMAFLPNRALTADVTSRSDLVAATVMAQADQNAEVRRVCDRVWRAATDGRAGTPGKQLQELRPHLVERISNDLQSGDVERARASGRAAAQLHDRLEASGGLIDPLSLGIREALSSDDTDAQISGCAGLAEILKAPKCHKGVLDKPDLSAALRGILLSEHLEACTAAAKCAVAAPPTFVSDPFVSELCESSYALDSDQMCGLQALVRADGAGTVLKLVIERAAASGPSEGQTSCLVAAAAAPAGALRQVVSSVADACVQAGVSDADAAGSVAKAWAAGLDVEGTQEFLSALVSRIECGQAEPHSQVAARLVGDILGAASVPPAHVDELLDALLPGALLSADGHGACAETFASSLQALVQACGASQLAEEYPPRILAALAPAAPGQPMEDSAVCVATFEALVPVLQNGITGATHRKASVESLALLARRVGATTLQGHAMKLAGPLVRALGEKSADPELQELVLRVLSVLIERAGASLRALKAALVTAFAKALDGPGPVQIAAGRACAALAGMEPKVVVKTLGKPPLKPANLEALATVLKALGPDGRKDVEEEVKAVLDSAKAASDDAVQSAASQVAAIFGG